MRIRNINWQKVYDTYYQSIIMQRIIKAVEVYYDENLHCSCRNSKYHKRFLSAFIFQLVKVKKNIE